MENHRLFYSDNPDDYTLWKIDCPDLPEMLELADRPFYCPQCGIKLPKNYERGE